MKRITILLTAMFCLTVITYCQETTVKVPDGGTTAITGITTTGANLLNLANPGVISFIRINADNTPTARSAPNFRSDLGLVIATDVEAHHVNLTSIAGLANASGWLKNNGSGVFSYSTPTASDVGLGNVTNESKATILSSPTITGTAVIPALTSSGSTSIDFSGNSGTFKSTTGANTLNGAVDVNAGTTPSVTLNSGKTNTGFFQVNGKTSGALKITAADAAAQTVTMTVAAQTTGAATVSIPDRAGVSGTFAFTDVTALSSLVSVGTIGTGTWQGTVLGSTYGGTGVNNAGRTLTINTNSGTVAFPGSGTTQSFPTNTSTLVGRMATADIAATNGATGATTIFTPTYSGWYRVTVYLHITTTGTSPVAGPVTITYTEPDGSVAQSHVLLMANTSGAVVTTTVNNSTTTGTVTGSIVIYAKTGVAIQYAIAVSGTFGSGRYQAHIICESLGLGLIVILVIIPTLLFHRRKFNSQCQFITEAL
jgi:hypothetical protein